MTGEFRDDNKMTIPLKALILNLLKFFANFRISPVYLTEGDTISIN